MADKGEKYEAGRGYDTFFDYYRFIEDGQVRYSRQTKPEWEDKITPDIEHADITVIKKALGM